MTLFCKRLFPGTAKGSCTPSCPKIQYKICNNNWCDNKLANSGVLSDRLPDIAHIADNGMNLAPVSGVNWRQFAYQTFYCQAAPGKYISGVSVRDFQSKAQRDFNDISRL